MCLLDKVLGWNDEMIECISETHRDPTNPLRRDARLSAVHGFEYGAQAAAIHGGLRAQAAGVVAAPGYFAELRNGELKIDRLDQIASALLVRARRLYGETANTVYECEVSADGKILVSGRVVIMMRS